MKSYELEKMCLIFKKMGQPQKTSDVNLKIYRLIFHARNLKLEDFVILAVLSSYPQNIEFCIVFFLEER